MLKKHQTGLEFLLFVKTSISLLAYLYISGFGFSDLILDEFNIKSREKKIIYFSFTLFLAMVMYQRYKDEYKCAQSSKNLWYKFEAHRWIEIEGSVVLKKLFSTNLTKNKRMWSGFWDTLLQFVSFSFFRIKSNRNYTHQPNW